MPAKYFTHLVTATDEARAASEWSGVVELQAADGRAAVPAELKACLAASFDVESDEIRILQWARLH